MRSIIICGGNVDSYILDYIRDGDYIICADSGYDHARKFGISPDIVIGDMDSVKSDYTSENTVLFPPKKDFTDSELALKFAMDKGFDEILMFGMIGTRMDHSFANLSLLLNCKGFDAKIIDKNNIIQMVFDEITLNGKIGDTISILPFSEDAIGVTTSGLLYTLNNATIKIGTSLGVSNQMTDNVCTIKVKEGKVLVIRSND